MPSAEVTLGADARSAGQARQFLARTLNAWGQSGDDGAALLLTELVTNAVLHARTEIVVRIEQRPGLLRLGVTDGSSRQPVVRHYSDRSTTGRGLGLVISLSLRWGIDPHPDGSKTVWADVGLDRARRGVDDTPVDLGAYPDLDESAPEGAWGQQQSKALIGSPRLMMAIRRSA